jgi:Flp pilus assembly protein TadD
LFRIGRNDEALVVLASATEKAPESPELRYHLGMAQLKAGQQDEARANLKLAVASDRSFRGIDGARAALATL